MASDRIFAPRDRALSSASNGEVDLGCPVPSPALIFSTYTLSYKRRSTLGGEGPWRTRWETCPSEVNNKAPLHVMGILFKAVSSSRTETMLMFAESPQLCALMDAMRAAEADPLTTMSTEDLDRTVAIDTPLAEGLADRKHDAPATPCHEVVVSIPHHELKSITGYPVSDDFCYARARQVPYSCAALGGVCLKVSSRD